MTKHGSRERAPKRLGRLDATVRVSGPKSDEVTTGPKSEDLHPAVRRLLSELDQLLSELERASSALPASPKQERERYICILVALSKFVHKVGGTLEQVRHIVELAKLLEDLDRGIVGPALERTHFGQGRTGDSSLVWEARGRVALGLEALTRLGEYRKDVARSALHDFPGIGRLMTAKSKDSVAVMLSWHDEFLRWKAGKSRSKNSYLASTFVVGTDFLKLCDGTPILLRRFAQIHFELASRI